MKLQVSPSLYRKAPRQRRRKSRAIRPEQHVRRLLPHDDTLVDVPVRPLPAAVAQEYHRVAAGRREPTGRASPHPVELALAIRGQARPDQYLIVLVIDVRRGVRPREYWIVRPPTHRVEDGARLRVKAVHPVAFLSLADFRREQYPAVP